MKKSVIEKLFKFFALCTCVSVVCALFDIAALLAVSIFAALAGACVILKQGCNE